MDPGGPKTSIRSLNGAVYSSLINSEQLLKRTIRNGEVVIGASPGGDADLSRLEALLNHYPYDFFSIDMQHSALNEVRLIDFWGMAAELETPVKLHTKDPREACLIGSLFDLGVAEAPHIDNVETMREAVDASTILP